MHNSVSIINQLTTDMTATMKKIVLLFLGITITALIAKGQGVESELGFQYVKAKYLMDTERYEDAIKAFSKIVKEDPNFEEALLFRAEAKYAMAAYKGSKADALEFASFKGITDKALMILGKSDYKLGNSDAALNSLTVATGSPYADPQVYEFIGDIYQDKGELLKACDFWAEGASLGSTKCESKSRKVCGSTKPTAKKSSERNSSNGRVLGESKSDDVLAKKDDKTKIDIKGKETTGGGDKNTKEDGSEEEEVVEVETEEQEKPKDNLPPEDDTPNEVVIDDELKIEIYGNALGKRRILDQPSILILSDEIGDVAIDICINKRGKVESAELNAELTTIKTQSLISLAIRKAKEFWFEKSDYKEQCGVMIFNKIK